MLRVPYEDFPTTSPEQNVFFFLNVGPKMQGSGFWLHVGVRVWVLFRFGV